MTFTTKLTGTAAILALALSGAAYAGSYSKDGDSADGGTVEQATMTSDATTTIVDTAMASPDHGTLVAAVKAAGLLDTLSGEGPYTVFAPTDAAFSELPEGTVETLLEPANKEALQGVLTYHVVAEELTASDLIQLIEANDGEATIETVSGADLTVMAMDGKVAIKDAAGNVSYVTTADLEESNGIIHVIDGVLLPAS